MEFDYSKLRGRIVEKYGTCKAFFEKLEITEVQAYNKLNGKSSFSQEDMVIWGKLLDVDVCDLGLYFLCLKGST